jgi:hypothetical protein
LISVPGTHNPALSLGGERQKGADVLARELREVREDLVVLRARRCSSKVMRFWSRMLSPQTRITYWFTCL